ncbi:MAG: hypothetical protein ACPHID_03035 [Thermoplasmatota archaeon]
MPSFIPHLVAPVLVALAFFPMRRKQILLWAPMVWVPDLDYFFAVEYHRALLSNIWIPVILFGSLVALWRRRDPLARFWEFATRPGAPGALLLTSYYFAGHILMDIFAGGVVVLWPLTLTNVFLFFQIRVDTATNTPVAEGGGGIEQGIPEVTANYTWLSAIDVAVGAFLVACIATWLGWRGWQRIQGRRPPVTVVRRAIQKP